MLDFSFGELALVILVAVLVVGPKDLPVVIRTIGKWMGQLKGITNEFRTGFKSALDELSLGNVGQEIKSIHEETKFIRDEQGNMQRVYDITDFVDHKTPSSTLKLDDAANKS